MDHPVSGTGAAGPRGPGALAGAGRLRSNPRMARRLTSYAAFWPYYVGEHAKPATRRIHFAGTATALACLALGVTVDAWWLAAAPVAGYAPAWLAHLTTERNRPATFTHPLYSLIADFHMFGLMCAGRMGREVERLLGGRP